MIAAYIRVSSKAQGLAMQRHAIQRVATQRGETISHWYGERVSTRNDRPELTRLRNDIRGGRFAKLYVYRLDRLTRGTICEAMNLLEEFKQHGCRVETIADGFSLLGPAADIVAAVLTWAANMEREAIRERIASARARVEASGGSWGRPRRMTKRQVAQARDLQKQGKTIRGIAMALKIPHATVQRALEREAIRERIASARARVEASGGSWGRPRRMTKRQVAQARDLQKQGKTIRGIAMALKIPHATVHRALARKPTPKRSVKRARKIAT